ncbi:MAG: sulfatase [Planctomycetes bacterium]|nr:sulfatase [Planctomycetota bacterium]MCB9905981.1 sulfatase [Planctomycetota bacterium]
MRSILLRSCLALALACAVAACTEEIPVEPDDAQVSSILPSGDVPSSFERAVVAHGPASVIVEARGVGTLRLTAALEGGAPADLGVMQLADRFERMQLALPGDGDRAVLVGVEGPDTVQWRTLALSEPAQDAAADSPLVGSCKGRNVVIFLADSLAARHTTVHGYERPTTPGLERLAADGVRFEAAHSQTSWTMPSVTSLFTSQTQERHGMLRMNQQLPDGIGTLAQSFHDAGYKTIGLIQNGIIWKHTRLDRGFDEYDVRREGNKVSEEIMQKARELMNVDRGRPLFLYVHLTPPHQPYLPPKSYSNDFVDPNYDGEVTGSIMDCAKVNHFKPPIDSPDVQHLKALYDGHIRYVDDMIAKTMDEVWKESPREDWVVVVTSDHGEAFLQHGDQGHNTQIYEEMVHIPLVIAAPGSPLPAGSEVPAPVSLLDVGPTLRELTGVPSHAQVEDGRSLVPLIADPARGMRRPFFFSSRYPKELDGQPTWVALRLGDYKLLSSETGYELYDLATDPFEAHDLKDEQPLRTRAMAELLEAWRRSGVRTDAASGALPEDAQDQLRKLGYVDSDGNEVEAPKSQR